MDPAIRGDHPLALRLWAHRELIFTLVKRDLKIRYKSSALGFLWSFGRPLFLMLVVWAVFSHIVKIGSSHPWLPYSLHILTGMLPWMFFAGALSESLHSVLGNTNVVKKVWLPTEVFPTAAVLGQLVHFTLALGVLGVFIAGYAIFGRIPAGAPDEGARLGLLIVPSWEIVLLPLLILLQTLLAFGFALILSSLNVFYRDVGSITEIALSAWFYLTPIIYPGNLARPELKEMGFEWIYWIYLCNPMTPITLAYRRLLYGRLFEGAPEAGDGTILAGLGVSCAVTAVVLGIGMVLFRRLSRKFADEL